MKNKGFTLIELLATITILSIIGVIIVIKVGETVNIAKDTLSENQIKNIINATKKYIIGNPDLLPEIEEQYDSIVTIDELIENGVIENDNVIDPKTKEQINGCIVISYNEDNNQYEYEYSKEKCNISEEIKYTFDYTGGEQSFTPKITGYYKLETWGAQGGTNGGYGGYSEGIIKLKKNKTIYINIGGQGKSERKSNYRNPGGYNGGGESGAGGGAWTSSSGESGGGATHIATISGLLSSLENNKESILIVSGGGGGKGDSTKGGSGGGFKGVDSGTSGSFQIAQGASQDTGYAFGQGASGRDGNYNYYASGGSGGAGGGWYGGFAIQNTNDYSQVGAGGGSGYIGNASLINKSMYCYDCQESYVESTKTISTTGASTERDTTNCPNGYSNNAISKCAKSENGYAIITFLGKTLK